MLHRPTRAYLMILTIKHVKPSPANDDISRF